MSEVLLGLGAKVHGFALVPQTEPALFAQLSLANRVNHVVGDVRDQVALRNMVSCGRPGCCISYGPAACSAIYREPVGNLGHECDGNCASARCPSFDQKTLFRCSDHYR